MAKFKQEVIDKIETDPDLFSAVSKALKIKPTSLPQTLKRNGKTLNQYEVMSAVAGYLGCDRDDLIEKETTEEAQETK